MKTLLLLSFTLAACAAPAVAQTAVPDAAPATAPPVFETPRQHNARMRWWREARFGMFVHWGLYSGLAGTWDGKTVFKVLTEVEGTRR